MAGRYDNFLSAAEGPLRHTGKNLKRSSAGCVARILQDRASVMVWRRRRNFQIYLSYNL
jgi:hypothetical protein